MEILKAIILGVVGVGFLLEAAVTYIRHSFDMGNLQIRVKNIVVNQIPDKEG